MTNPHHAVERISHVLGQADRHGMRDADSVGSWAGSLRFGDLRLAIAALTAQQTAPAGWRLVPVEPVREMVEAAAREFGAGASTHFQIKAAIAAAPQQTATAVSREEIARSIWLTHLPANTDDKWDEYLAWYKDGADNPNSSVHYSTIGQALKAADAVLSLLSGGEGLARAEAGR